MGTSITVTRNQNKEREKPADISVRESIKAMFSLQFAMWEALTPFILQEEWKHKCPLCRALGRAARKQGTIRTEFSGNEKSRLQILNSYLKTLKDLF